MKYVAALLMICCALLGACKKADTKPDVSLRFSGTQVDNLAPYVLAFSYDAASGQHNPIFAASDVTGTPQTRKITPAENQRLEVTAELRNASGPVPAGAVLKVEVLVGEQVRRTIQVDASTPRQPSGLPQASTFIEYSEL
ncbi:hypothetical protein GCM10027048_29090 [Hymenobacter coalescens]